MIAVLSGFVGALVAAGVLALAEHTQRPATVSPDGWRTLRPGWLINSTILGCTALGAVIIYFLWIGGSGLADAAAQNFFAMLILAACAAGALYTAWMAYGRTAAWKGNELRVRRLWGRETVHRLSDAVHVRRSDRLGAYRITFRDGSRLWLAAYQHGARQLMAKLPRRAFPDRP